ncbi:MULTISPECIES: YncE family protein [unclassified Thiocapsa]|uniref:YncE family protein n=1 Tax=unclassified Thiocapsa TaxID=2641286 RepID=UPI0035B37767
MDRRQLTSLALTVSLLLSYAVSAAGSQPSFITFETGQVRPLALTEDGKQLLALNTPDNRIEIFNIDKGVLLHDGSIPVGLEPTAIAVRNDREVWVVNHLSDSVSIVDLKARHVRRTLLVGDEPRDIVFASGRAFVATAHRGQHRTHPSIADVPGSGDPLFLEPSVPRADVWVFDAAEPGDAVGGKPLQIIELFGDTPRSLAVSPDGRTVYAAVFHSGNQTTVIPDGLVCDGFKPFEPCEAGDAIAPGGNPGPATNASGVPAPEVGLIVKYNNGTGHWEDELGRNWDSIIRLDLPDLDVFAIDAVDLKEIAAYRGVGTILFNMAVNPQTGAIYVSNTEARNEVRFEGPGHFAGSTVLGHLHEARITVIRDGSVVPRHLNKHIDYAVHPAPQGTKEHSLATPLEIQVSKDGKSLYVAAFGSSKVGIFSTESLEDNSFDPTESSSNYVSVTGGGPSGIILDEARRQLYTLTRFDNGISVIDLSNGKEVTHILMPNPEPQHVVDGRPVLYDAVATSSNGEASCAACHVFGDLDSLAWDLGNPDDEPTESPLTVKMQVVLEAVRRVLPEGYFPRLNGTGDANEFSPMKGPMTTQTLRGMVNSGHMHWRGDRSNGFFGVDEDNTNDARLSFMNFIVAFDGLLGSEMSSEDSQLQEMTSRLTDFALEITMPPNPVRALDNSLTARQEAGRTFYFGGPDGTHVAGGLPLIPGRTGFTCDGCHRLDPAQGFFGTDGDQAFVQEEQIMKIPQIRNMYQKVGMFGVAPNPLYLEGDNGPKGPQVRGFGYVHDGSVDTLFRFFRGKFFAHPETLPNLANPIRGGGFDEGDPQRHDVVQFVLAYDSDLAPIVGQQVTRHANGHAVDSRIDLLLARSEVPFVSKVLGGETTECEVVVKGSLDGVQRGWLHVGDGRFLTDSGDYTMISNLRVLSDNYPLTFTCVPPGSGHRMAVDRDQDGILDAVDPCPADKTNSCLVASKASRIQMRRNAEPF